MVSVRGSSAKASTTPLAGASASHGGQAPQELEKAGKGILSWRLR